MMKPFRITSLEAHQIGPFGDLNMVFPEKPAGMEDKAEVHILTGENGTGKTTILELLSRSVGPGSLMMLLGKLKKQDILFSKISFSNDALVGLRTKDGKLYFDGQMGEVLQNYRICFDLMEPKLQFALFAYSGSRQIEETVINSVLEEIGKPLENSNELKLSTDSKLLLNWIANTLTKELIANSESDIESSKKLRSSITAIENAISKVIDQPIRLLLSNKPLKVVVEINKERLDFNYLPEGLKSVISWLGDLLMRMDRIQWVNETSVFERNFILLLDEIEVHMHPKWQRKILPAVQGLFPNAQIFISTHSPFVIGSVDGAWIHKLVKPNGDSVAEAPVLSEDGHSVHYYLREIFDIDEEFGVGVQADLEKFYALRDDVFKSTNGTHTEELLKIARKIGNQSTELWQIMEMEIRQINRRKQLQLTL